MKSKEEILKEHGISIDYDGNDYMKYGCTLNKIKVAMEEYARQSSSLSDEEIEAEAMTEQECIKWVQENLPFAMKSKKGKLQYPFKAAYYAREIEQCMGKSLYKLLAGQKGYKREFVEWLIKDQEIFYGELTEGYIINDNPRVKDKTSLDELHEYWKTEIKSTKSNESLK